MAETIPIGWPFPPFKDGMKIIELGGGSAPWFHPNIDVRQVPGVDYVQDLSEPLMLETGSVDGTFSKFSLEHISWKKVKAHIREIFRVLKPGGIAVFITANTLEQMKVLVNSPRWSEDMICMLFGGQGFDQDTHKNGWSPDYAYQVFKEAGFCEVKTYPWPQANTDMIIEATKSQAEVNWGLPKDG